jgi:hypothetical protein
LLGLGAFFIQRNFGSSLSRCLIFHPSFQILKIIEMPSRHLLGKPAKEKSPVGHSPTGLCLNEKKISKKVSLANRTH